MRGAGDAAVEGESFERGEIRVGEKIGLVAQHAHGRVVERERKKLRLLFHGRPLFLAGTDGRIGAGNDDAVFRALVGGETDRHFRGALFLEHDLLKINARMHDDVVAGRNFVDGVRQRFPRGFFRAAVARVLAVPPVHMALGGAGRGQCGEAGEEEGGGFGNHGARWLGPVRRA